MIRAHAVRQPAGTFHPVSTVQAKKTSAPSQLSNQLVQRRLAQTRPQPKLSVNRPGDVFEQEADRVADTVMRMDAAGHLSAGNSPPRVQRKCAKCEEEKMVQRKCAECDEEEKVQRKESLSVAPHAGAEIVDGAETAQAAVASGGSPLPRDVRSYFEPRFGHDFSEVRVHTGGAAANAARAISARAYTLGSDIAFASGEFAPASTEGRRLLAHELVHVMQQDARVSEIRRQLDDEPELELERKKPKTLDEARMEHLVERTLPVEQSCPKPPTNIGNLTPSPDCSHEGGDLPEGDVFNFCVDSDVFSSAIEAKRIRELVAKQPSGSEFQVRAYASPEGPGKGAAREQYNMNLSCHRLNRVIRELINAGVQETDIEGAALGATTRFGSVPSTTHFNRAAVIHAIPQAGQARPSAAGMTPLEIAEAGRKRLIKQDYKLGADAYFARWTCGRYRTLADAVARTNVRVASQGDKGGPGPDLGTTGLTGPNTIILDRAIQQMTDPIECAASRIADLTFHHFVRPVLPGFADQHTAGMHLVHLAGLSACVSGVPGATKPRIAEPDPKDQFEKFQPDCADPPLPGAMKPQRGPAKPDTPAIFISSTPVLTDPSGALVMDPPSPGGVGVHPANLFRLTANIDASGDPAAVRDHEIGFVQTVLSEEWVNTHVDGRRDVRQLPLPLRDGAARLGDPLSDPPWFDANAKIKARPGLNNVSMLDGPNFRAFKFLPDLERSTFVERLAVPRRGGGPDFTMERPRFRPDVQTPIVVFEPGKPLTVDQQKQADRRKSELDNVPDRGHRLIRFMTWVVARRIGAPATHGATQFLEGVKMEYRLDVDWSAQSTSQIKGSGSYKTVATRAAQSDSAQILLRGATPADFVSADGDPLFAEFLKTEAAVPRAQAQGLTQSQYLAAVRAIVASQPAPRGLVPPFVVKISIDMRTGHAILDTPDLKFGAVKIERAFGGHDIDPSAAAAFARVIFPDIRQLVLSGPLSAAQPQSAVVALGVSI